VLTMCLTGQFKNTHTILANLFALVARKLK